MSQLVPHEMFGGEEDESLLFATMFDYQTLTNIKPTFANFDGLHSGVPTRTTATITPTQLRNLEQTYIELSNCRPDQTNHAGFVPPSITQPNNYGILNPGGYSDVGPTTALHVSTGPLSASGESSCSPGLPEPKRRNMGGRRPTKAPQDISPEEEERRRIRRERNKAAAARCRKRRLDHTNELQEETDKLEDKKKMLREEIRKLTADRIHLETILNKHLLTCMLTKRSASPPDVKPQPSQYAYSRPVTEDGVRVKVEVEMEDLVLGLSDNDIFTTPAGDKRMLTQATTTSGFVNPSTPIILDTPPILAKPKRPNFLQLPNNKTSNKIAGIEITTPSNGIPFNFESLMEGGTGLTPVHPHPIHLSQHAAHPACSQQQRTTPDVTSPDSHTNLVSL